MKAHKKNAREIFKKALLAVDPLNLNYELDTVTKKEIMLFGSGKASLKMAEAVMMKIGDRLKDGFIVSNYEKKLPKIEVFKSSHPTPSKKSVEAANKMIAKLRSLKEDDFFIYLLSGGSSALLQKPCKSLALEDLIFVNDALLACGASIAEINKVRKQLSFIQGSRLANMTKASGMVFVVSDVVGDDLGTIGSAPFYADESTCEDAKEVLLKYGLWKKIPESVQNVIKLCENETPKEQNPKISHKIVASNTHALKAALDEAKSLGYEAKIVRGDLNDDVEILSKYIANLIKKQNSDKPICLIFGGESRVVLKGDGKGGRNQELALLVLKEIKDDENIVFLSAGTDGIDGNTKAAGAVVAACDYKDDIDAFLSNNDSYHFHERADTLIVTGESGTNIMDIMIAIKE